MVVADKKQSLTITGTGDVLEPNDGVIGITGFLQQALVRKSCLF